MVLELLALAHLDLTRTSPQKYRTGKKKKKLLLGPIAKQAGPGTV